MTSKQYHVYCGLRFLFEDLPAEHLEFQANNMSPANKVILIKRLARALKDCHTTIEASKSLAQLKRVLQHEKNDDNKYRPSAGTNRVLQRTRNRNVRTESEA